MMDRPPNGSRQRVTVSIAWLYVLSGLGMAFLSVVSITALVWLRPTMDNTPLVVIIIGFASTTLASIIAALKSQEAKHISKELGYRVNGRLDELVSETEKRAKVEGRVEGVAATGAVSPALATSIEDAKP